MKVRNLFFTVAALSAICAQAATFECGGLYYTTTGANSVAVARVPAEKATNEPYKGVYIIPEQVYYDGANYQVTAIADSAFFQSKATEVQVPNTVTTIGECAFAYATDLANITLPLHLKDVSKMLLAGTNVVNVAVPEGVKNIGWGAFQSCPMLHTMLLPSTTKRIDAYGYNNCHNLFEIYCAAPTAPEASGWAIFIGLSGIDVIVPDADAYISNLNGETFTSTQYVFPAKVNDEMQNVSHVITLATPASGTLTFSIAKKQVCIVVTLYCSDATAITEVVVAQSQQKARKYIQHGSVVIERNGEKYSVAGGRM